MKYSFPLLLLIATAISVTSCSKKKSGVCYCKYLSGDKKEYDLTGMDRSKAQDSCQVLNGYASAFAGDCKLK